MRSSTRHEPRHLGAGMAVLGRLRPVAAPGSALVGRRVETAAKPVIRDPRAPTLETGCRTPYSLFLFAAESQP